MTIYTYLSDCPRPITMWVDRCGTGAGIAELIRFICETDNFVKMETVCVSTDRKVHKVTANNKRWAIHRLAGVLEDILKKSS